MQTPQTAVTSCSNCGGFWNISDVYKQYGWQCSGDPVFINAGQSWQILIGYGRWHLGQYYGSCHLYDWLLRSDSKYRSHLSQVTKWSNNRQVNTDQMRTRNEKRQKQTSHCHLHCGFLLTQQEQEDPSHLLSVLLWSATPYTSLHHQSVLRMTLLSISLYCS